VRRFYLVIITAFIIFDITAVHAQSDSIKIAEKNLSHADSLDRKVNGKIDSAQLKINSLLHPDLNKLFSKRRAKTDTIKTDTLASNKQNDQQKMDSLKGSLTHRIDSLKGLHLPTEKYTRKLDSLNHIGPAKYLQQGEAKINDIENKVNQPVNKVNGAINEKLSLMNKEGGAGTNLPTGTSLPNALLPGAQTALPNTQLPGNSLPNGADLKIDNPLKDQMGEAGQIQEKIGDAKSLPQEQMGKLKSIDEVKGVQGKLGAANQITDKAQAHQGDVKNIAQGNLNEVKELPKTLETQAGKVDELQGFQKETGQFGQYKQMADKAKDPEALKAEAMKQATTKAIDHFAGKQEVLQAAMDKMSKLKSKYSSLNSMKDIPKRKPNEMKGKPLIERLVPGIAFQIQKSSNVLLDYNPLIGYRITGRFTAGAGWNERLTIGKHIRISLDDRIYGPRVFADFKIGKGFSVRTDIEKMNTYVPALTSNGYSTSEEYRAWVWSAFIGMKKEYKFVKNVKGTFQMMYNLYDDHNNSPYADRLNVRFGFDFPMKKKVKKLKAEPPN